MNGKTMRFEMMVAVTALAATTGIAHGERDNEKTQSAPDGPLSVFVVQADTGKVQRQNALGVCGVVNVGPTGTGQGDMFPVLYVNTYYFKVTNSASNKIDNATAKVSIVKPPKHGRVEPVMSDGDMTDPRYLPDDGFLGNDSFVLQVGGNGYTIQLHYYFYVTNDADVSSNQNRVCKGDAWKISSSFTTPTLDSVRLQSLLAAGGSESQPSRNATQIGKRCDSE